METPSGWAPAPAGFRGKVGRADDSLHILIVDDSELIRRVLKLALGKRGVKTSETTNGEEAVSWLAAKTCDALLTDFEMPLMDGLELLAWVKVHQPDLPVIFMTATLNSEVEASALLLGASTILEKPFESKDLYYALSKL